MKGVSTAVIVALVIASSSANAESEKSLSMKQVEALHAKLEECESEYSLVNPPTTLECLKVRSRLLAHHGSEDSLKEAAGMLKAAQAAAKIFSGNSKGK